MKEASNDRIEGLRILYEENARLHRYYQDWRGRVLTRFTLTVGFGLVAVGHVYTQPEVRDLLIPGLLSALALSGVVAAFLDSKNAKMIDGCEDAGNALGEELMEQSGIESRSAHFYIDQHDLNSKERWLTYKWMLRVLYLGSALAFLFLAFEAKRRLGDNKTSILTPDPSRVQPVMIIQPSTPKSERALGQA